MYVNNNSSYTVNFDIVSSPMNTCYPLVAMYKVYPNTTKFSINAGKQYVFNGFTAPAASATSGFPTAPTGGWKWTKIETSGSLTPITESVAQSNLWIINKFNKIKI